MCSSIFYPNFLLQKPLPHGTESCIKISAFLVFRCVYFSVTEKWTVWQLRIYCITNIMTVYKHYDCVQTLCLCTNIMTVYKHYVCVQTLCLCTNIMSVYKHYVCVQTLWLCTNIMSVYKRVNSRSHDIILKDWAERVPYFVTYFLKCYESTRSLNVFYIHFFFFFLFFFFSTPVIQSWTWVRFLDTECGCCSITKFAQA